MRSREPGASFWVSSEYRVPKLWAILNCFPRPQAGKWLGSWAAGIRTGTNMGSMRIQGKDFSLYAVASGLIPTFTSLCSKKIHCMISILTPLYLC